nr:helix-turn-helix domain-containing protein [Actinocatenispora rupis]
MERKAMTRELTRRYLAGESLRALAASTGRSYWFVRSLLCEAGVRLRSRGGARRGARMTFRPDSSTLPLRH